MYNVEFCIATLSLLSACAWGLGKDNSTLSSVLEGGQCYHDSLAHGEINFFASEPGSNIVATYTCDESYVLVGVHVRTCRSGTWVGDMPSCAGRCPDPHSIENGYMTVHCVYEDCTTKYSCEQGYQLSGDQFLTCSNHSWTQSRGMPNCTAVMCSAPPNIANAEILYIPTMQSAQKSGFAYNTIVRYKCTHPYVRSGASELVCTENGTWSGNPPKCKLLTSDSSQTCDAPSLPHGSARRMGNIATYSCQFGYELVGVSTRHCEGERWSDEQPVCVLRAFCAEPDAVPFADISVQPPAVERHKLYWFKTQVNYTCQYNESMTSSIACDENGEWNGTQPNCTDPRIDDAADLNDSWKRVLFDNPHWIGSYVYEHATVYFQLFLVTKKRHADEQIVFLYLDHAAKLHLTVDYTDKTFIFYEIRLFKHNGPFQPGTNWRFTGHMKHQDNQWHFFSSRFQQKGFSNLMMSATRADASVPNLSEPTSTRLSHGGRALGFGILLAMLLVILAAALASYYARQQRHKQQASHHEAVTSFENPVYGCETAPARGASPLVTLANEAEIDGRQQRMGASPPRKAKAGRHKRL